MTLAASEGVMRFTKEGGRDGAEVKQLCSIPGYSIATGWFKSNYAVPLHKHDADCLYHVLSGNMRLGTEELGPGDGVFVPANTPYAFKAGSAGVEVLEFRHVAQCSVKVLADNPAFWDKAISHIAANRERWLVEPRP
jgi:mannose-6-phosphate isomerase-like protein (cupin superfamily)